MKNLTATKLALILGLAWLLPLWSASAQVVFAPLGDSNQIARIDMKTGAIQKLYDKLENPHGLAASPDGHFLFAASLLEKIEGAGSGNEGKEGKESMEAMARPEGVSEADHAAHHGGAVQQKSATPKTFSFITKLDAATGKILSRIDVGKFTHHVTVSPDGAYVIGVQSGAGRIVVIDTRTDKVLRYIPVGAAPNYAVITKDGAKVFVSSAGTNAVTVLDGKSWRKLAAIPAGGSPEHLTLSPDEKRLYAVNVGSNELSIINTETLKETGRVPTGDKPHGVAFSAKAQSVIVTNRGDDTLSVFTAGGEPTQTVPLSPQPYHVTASDDGARLWVSSRKEGRIWVVSSKDLTVLNTLTVPGIAHQIVVAR